MGLRADLARPQRVSGSARTDSQRAEWAHNPVAFHVNFGDDSALNALTRTQWTAALRASLRRILRADCLLKKINYSHGWSFFGKVGGAKVANGLSANMEK